MFERFKSSVPDVPTTPPRAAHPVDQSPQEGHPVTRLAGRPNISQGSELTLAGVRNPETRTHIHETLLKTLNLNRIESSTIEELSREIGEIITETLLRRHIAFSSQDIADLTNEMIDEIRDLGPISPLLRDDTISDILINGSQQVYVEINGKLNLSATKFRDEQHLNRTIDKIVASSGRRLDESNPYVDARLPDGSRFNAVIPPIAVDGSLVSIRKIRRERISINDLIRTGTLNDEMAAYLEAAVRARLNIIISGGTGSGKTTMLNILSSFISRDERVLTIEDTAELQLQQPHVARMESRPPNIEGKGAITQRECLRNALRMRPDRIIIGETRGDEVIDMLQAMNTGHDGSMTTIHANSPRDAVSRLENMVSMSGVEIRERSLRAQIASAIQIIIQLIRMSDGTRRISTISEITGMEGDIISMQTAYKLSTDKDQLGRDRNHSFLKEMSRSFFGERIKI